MVVGVLGISYFRLLVIGEAAGVGKLHSFRIIDVTHLVKNKSHQDKAVSLVSISKIHLYKTE